MSMRHPSKHMYYAAAAISLAIAGAVLSQRTPAREAAPPSAAPDSIDARALGRVLGEGRADVVVLALDEPKHALRFAEPASLYGADDAAIVARAPRARRLVLAGHDVVRADRLARKLLAAGRDVTVVAGGLAAWDAWIEAEPAAPAADAGPGAWADYREHVAQRRVFGGAQAAPVAPVRAAVPAAGARAPAKKREGC